jgi:hypothetical protein
MRRQTLPVFAALCVAFAAVPAAAQQPPLPPKVLQIYREEVKPGKGPAHEKWEAGWPEAFAKAKMTSHYLAMTSSTGPAEAWFVAGFDSWAAWEKAEKEVEGNATLSAETNALSVGDAEFISGWTSLVLTFREDLSNAPNIDVSKMRYFRIVTFRVRPGHDADLANNARIVRDAYAKAKISLPWAVYQVSAGMTGPAYMVWIPMRSLAEIDATHAASKAIQDAEGEEGQKALAKAAADGYLSVSQNIFAFSPKMSYPPAAWVASDPGYWAPMRAAAPPPTDSKPVEKK